MISGYRYTTILVTGILHIILGCIGWVLGTTGITNSDITIANNEVIFYFYQALVPVSIWILSVGCIGVLAGVNHLADEHTKRLKIAYMVTSILSVCMFLATAFKLHILLEAMEFKDLGICIPGLLVMFFEFLLAIGSFSICRCCSNMHTSTWLLPVPFIQTVYIVPPTTGHAVLLRQEPNWGQEQNTGRADLFEVHNQTLDVQTVSTVKREAQDFPPEANISNA